MSQKSSNYFFVMSPPHHKCGTFATSQIHSEAKLKIPTCSLSVISLAVKREGPRWSYLTFPESEPWHEQQQYRALLLSLHCLQESWRKEKKVIQPRPLVGLALFSSEHDHLETQTHLWDIVQKHVGTAATILSILIVNWPCTNRKKWWRASCFVLICRTLKSCSQNYSTASSFQTLPPGQLYGNLSLFFLFVFDAVQFCHIMKVYEYVPQATSIDSMSQN